MFGLRVLLLACLLLHVANSQRIIIKHDAQHADSIVQRAKQTGFTTVASMRGLTVLQREQPKLEKASTTASKTKIMLDQVRNWPGVQFVEKDEPRFLHRPFTSGKAEKAEQGLQQHNCDDKDIPLSNDTLPEYQPYGLEQIQATSPRLPNSTHKAGVIVCIVDSGVDSGHPDLLNNSMDGCKYEDPFAPAGCPFIWDKDAVSHGSHVAGTIAAQKNGQGVVGVIPGPAELYVVRVFNNSGDVNQGQGLVYGSTLILAFTQCEGRLAAMQNAYPDRNYRMVVSLSLGAAGPLTIERMFFREAMQRGDMLFVASSGNNGTAPTMIEGKLSSSLNPGSYPGAYPEVISVSAVDCANRLASFSQKNPTVDLAAPGVFVLSTASREYAPRLGYVAGGFVSQNGEVFVPGGIANSENQVRFSGTGKVTGKVADCGTAAVPCPAAKDAICLVQYDPQLKPVNVSKAGKPPTTRFGMLTSIFGPPPGEPQADTADPAIPTKFYCDLMDYCMKQGAKAVLIGAPAVTTGFYGSWGLENPDSFQDLPLIANLNCSQFNCSCWPRIQGANRLPAAGLSLRQFGEVKAAATAASKTNKTFVGSVESKVDAYQRLSGTSMAVPHVSGALARVWAAYPHCNAQTVRTAFEETALDLGPKGRDVQFGHGLVQAEAAFDYLARQPCAKGSGGLLRAEFLGADADEQQGAVQGGDDGAGSSAGSDRQAAAAAGGAGLEEQHQQKQQQQQVAKAAPAAAGMRQREPVRKKEVDEREPAATAAAAASKQ